MSARDSFLLNRSWRALVVAGFAMSTVALGGCTGAPTKPEPPATDVDLPKCAGKVGGGPKVETLAHLAWGYMKDNCPSLPQELDVFAACKQSKSGLVGLGTKCPRTTPPAAGQPISCIMGIGSQTTLDVDVQLGLANIFAVRGALRVAGYDAFVGGIAVKPIAEISHDHQGQGESNTCDQCLLTYAGAAVYQLFAFNKTDVGSALSAGTPEWLAALRLNASNGKAWRAEGNTYVCGYEEDGLGCESPDPPGTHVPMEPREVDPPKPLWGELVAVSTENP